MKVEKAPRPAVFPDASGKKFAIIAATFYGDLAAWMEDGARRALRKNVNFFDSAAAAERAGFRACKRCRPNGDGLAQAQASAQDQVFAHAGLNGGLIHQSPYRGFCSP